MANDEQTPDSQLPPKLDLRKKGIVKGPPAEDAAAATPAAPTPAEPATPTPATPTPAAADKPKEPVVTKPAGSPPEVSKTVAGARPVAAPKTVRIASPAVAQKPEGDGSAATPKTIRIARPPAASTDAAASPKTVSVKPPADTADPPAASADAEPTVQTLKKDSPKPGSTVPIPLDDLALPSTTDQPKTIRLKKPAGGATRSGTGKVAAKAGDEGAPADGAAGSPPTRKRTIKVKRPDRGTRKGRPVTVARTKVKAAKAVGTSTGDEAVVAEVGASAKQAASVQAETGAVAVLTVVSAVVALIVVGVVAYLFAVQAFPLMGLPWPGIS